MQFQLLTSYLLHHLQTTERREGDEIEALKLIVEKPDPDSIRNYPNDLPHSVKSSLLFKDLFEASRCLQNTIVYYEETSQIVFVRMWKFLNNLLVHWHLRNFGRLPPLNEQLKPPYYQEIKELKRRKALVAKEIGTLYKQLQNSFELEDQEIEFGKVDELVSKDVFYSYLRPTFWHKYRVHFIFGLGFSIISYRYLTRDWGNMVFSIKGAFLGFKNLWFNWIYEPMIDLWRSIRYKKEEFIVISPQALETDKESLDRMVFDFADKARIPKEQVETMINEGDYQILLREYEKEITKPVRGALFGIKSLI
jgi:hypothetical protein